MDLWTAFMLGLVGSVHCAGMCGPLALALPAGQGTSFLVGRGAYNAGRLVTYCFLGLIFGLIGKTLLLAGVQRWLSIALGVCLLLGLISARRLALAQPIIKLIANLKTAMGSLLRQRSVTALFTLGTLNGFLPCGLVYAACAGATSTANLLQGTLYMLAFGAGTIPMMLGISLSGRLVPVSFRLKLLRTVPFAVFALALLLILRGMELGIPYISPNLSDGSASCCAMK